MVGVILAKVRRSPGCGARPWGTLVFYPLFHPARKHVVIYVLKKSAYPLWPNSGVPYTGEILI